MAAAALSGIFVVGAKRTPFGAFGGSLKNLSATDLAVIATRSALQQASLDPTRVDASICGNVIPSSPDAAYLARHVALRVGCLQETPAVTVNRLCGSGFESVIQGSQYLALNMAKIVICAGTENMSQAPLQVQGQLGRWGTPLGKGLHLRDALWDGLTDAYVNTPMGMTAENLAQHYNITREECDEFAIRSQKTWHDAQQNGLFDLEMAPVEISDKKKTQVVNVDEHPRPDTALEKIAKLKPVFQENGVVTAANASGICDGAGSVILASAAAVEQYNLQPLARVVSFGITGCDPKIMGIGPVQAIRMALDKAGLTLDQMDRIEINEAFAAQFLACAKELNLDMTKTNLHGGAISLGHPLGASGSRILAHLTNEFRQAHASDHQYHVGAACIGGGQGIAVILERV